jgi:hypothetical protein
MTIKNTHFFIYIFCLLFAVFSLFAQDNKKTAPHGQYYKNSNGVPSIIQPSKYPNGTYFDNNEGKGVFNRKKSRALTDSSDKKNTINVWENNIGEVVIDLKLKDYDQKIKISVWNMLGKKVIDDFDDYYKNLDEKHIIKNSHYLSKGVYLLRVQGEKVRLDAKFVISR